MAAIGYGALPITVSLRGMQKTIRDNLIGPMEKASKAAGDSFGGAIKRSAADGVAAAKRKVAEWQKAEKDAAGQVEAAQNKVSAAKSKVEQANRKVAAAALDLERAETNSAARIEAAQARVNELKRSGAATSDQVAAAEARVADARLRGQSDVLKKENALQAARDGVIKATSGLEGAEAGAASARDRHATSVERLQSAEVQLKNAQNGANSSAEKGAGILGRLRGKVDETGQAMKKAGSETEGFGTKIGGSLKRMGGMAAGLVGLAGAASTLQAGFKKVTAIEDTTASLGILMGSTEKAAGLMDELVESNQKTPYMFDTWADAGKTLVAFGVEADQVSRTVTALGEAAAASGKGEMALGRMSEAFGQAAASGKMSMETINRLADGGVQGLAILANEYGVTTEEMQKMISSGAVSAKEGIEILTNGILEGSEGAAGSIQSMEGVMDKMSQTTSGKLTLLKASFNNLAASIFEELNPAIGWIADKLTDAVYWVRDAIKDYVAPAIGDVAGSIGDLGVRIGDALGPVWDRVVDGAEDMVPHVQDAMGRVRDAFSEGWSVVTTGQGDTGPLAALIGEDRAAMALDVIKTVRDALMGLWDDLRAAFEAVQPMIMPVVKILGGALMGALRNLWDATGGMARGVWAMVKSVFEGLWPILKQLAPLIGGILVGAVIAVAKVFEGLTWVLARVVDVLAWVYEKIVGPIISVFGQLIAAVMGLFNPFSTLGTIVKGAFDIVAAAAQWVYGGVLKPIFDAIVGAVGWMGETLMGLWANVLQPFFTLIGDGLTWLWENALVPAGQGIMDGIHAVGDAINAFYENVIVPIGDLLAQAFEWLRSTAETVFQAIVDYFQRVGDGYVRIWNELIKPVFEAIGNFLQCIWDSVIVPVFDAFVAAWRAVGDGIAWVWNNVIMVAWNAMGGALNSLWANVVQPVLGWISDRWRALGDAMTAVKNWIVDNVFGGIQSGLETVKSAFRVAVDAIGRLWDRVRAAAAKPIKFVIDTVFNNGIVAAWNKVAGWVGLDKVGTFKPAWLGQFAQGGVLPGYTPGRDVYNFVEPRTGMGIALSGGEAIIRPEATRALGTDWVDGVNAAAKMGGAQGVSKFLGGYDQGGVIGSIVGLVNKHFPGMTITSTFRPGSNDHHGTGNAVDFSDGTDSTPGMRAAAQWFYSNYGKGLYELIHSPFNNNVKNGQNVGDGFGFYGAGTMGQHRNHVHVASPAPLGDPKNMVEMIWDGAVAVVKSMRERVVEQIAGVLDPIEKKLPTFPGLIGDIPKAAFGKMKEAIVNFLGKRADEFAPAGGSIGNAESWREMAMAAMRRNGFNADDPAQVNAMLAQIMSESGGDPNRAQEIVDINGTGESAGLGLLQIIPDTFAAHRDPTLPNDRRDPWANMNAALRYYRSKYGGDLTVMWGHGHGYADGGILPPMPPMPAALYDQGGMWPSGTIGVNLSGDHEAVLKSEQWKLLRRVADELKWAFTGTRERSYDGLAGAIGNEDVARTISDVAAGIGKFLATSDEAVKAMEALESARESEKSALEAIKEAEEELAAAREEAEGDSDSSEKVAEAEKMLNEAREDGDQEKIAEAEKALNEARESASKDEESRAEKVKAAEEKLADAREKGAEATAKVVDAENAVFAAQLNTAEDLFKSFADAVGVAADSAEKFVKTVTDFAADVEESRQAVSALQLDLAEDRIKMVSAVNSLRFAEWEFNRARIDGAISVAKASANLEAKRRESMRVTYDAFGWEIDRYTEAGLDAWGMVTDGVVRRTADVRAAEAELAQAQARSLLDQHKAQMAVREASFAAARATMTHARAAQLLELSTVKLQQQAARLYGLDKYGATAAQRGTNGLKKGVGGVFGFLGGLLTTGFSLLTGNIGGAVAGGSMLAKSVGDMSTGFREYDRNKKETKQALKGLSPADKAALAFGGIGAAGAIGLGVAGAGQYGVESVKGGLKVGSDILDSAFTGVGEGIRIDMERIELEHARRVAKLEADYKAKLAELDMAEAVEKAAAEVKTVELQAVVDLSEITAEIAKADNTEVVKYLAELADMTRDNRDRAVRLHEDTVADLASVVSTAREAAEAAGEASVKAGNRELVVNVPLPTEKTSYTAREVEAILNSISSAQDEMKIRISELEGRDAVTAADYDMAARR